jgi:hypothetical protein
MSEQDGTADLPPVPVTGHAPADAAGERLATVDQAPLDEHVATYDDVHRQLQEALADVDDA